MDETRFRAFTSFDPDVFASFVADLWERLGYDCSLVDPADSGGANVIARRENGGTVRIATVSGSDIDFDDTRSILESDQGVRSVDVVVVPQVASGTSLRPPLGVELFDGRRLAELVAGVDASGLVDEYLLGHASARERVIRRRRARAGEDSDEELRRYQRSETSRADSPDSTATATSAVDVSRGREFTLVVAGVVGLCLAAPPSESIGGAVPAFTVLVSSVTLVIGMVLDARSFDYRGFTGGRGAVVVGLLAVTMCVAIVTPLVGVVGGVGYLARRRTVERAAVGETARSDGLPLWTPLGRHPWYWAVVAGTLGWLVVLVALLGGNGAGEVGTATALVGIGSWIAVPAGSYFDGRRRGNEPSLGLLAVGVVPYAGALAGFVYVVRRERGRGVDAAGGAGGRGRTPRSDAARRLERLPGATTDAIERLRGSLGALPRRLFSPVTGTRAGTSGTSEHRDRASNGTGAPDGGKEATAGSGDGSGGHDLGPPVRRPPRESRTIRYDGIDFRCQSVGSGDGRWRVAWGTAPEGTGATGERVFLLQYEARQFVVDATSVSECAVGTDGTVAVFEKDGDTVSRIRVLSPNGETVLDRGFGSALGSVAVTSRETRTLVGWGLRSPPRLVVVDGRTGGTVLEQEITTDPDVVEFRDGDGDPWLVVGNESRPTPDVAVRVHDGEVVQP